MAISNIEGSTLGGLDLGRGSGTRILAFNGVVTLGTNVTDTCVHSVTADGVVTDTNSGSATHALGVSSSVLDGYGFGVTLETPAIADNDEVTFKLTFGEVSTTAVTAATTDMKIQVATVSVGVTDTSASDFLPVPAAIKSLSGNQVQFSIGELTTNGANVAVVATDKIHIQVIAFATPA